MKYSLMNARLQCSSNACEEREVRAKDWVIKASNDSASPRNSHWPDGETEQDYLIEQITFFRHK